jgi:Protein of unknown function (DUF2961)
MKFSRGNYVKFSAVLATVLLAMTPGSAPCQSTADLFRITDGVTRNQMNFHQVSVPIGGEHVLADLTGPGKVTYFYITDDSTGKWYPGLVLKVFWDEAPDPSICVPLADFFGAVGGRTVDYESVVMQEYGSCWEDANWRTFSSLYCGHPLNENGVNRMYRWYVANPVRFQEALKVEIQNQHDNGTPTTRDADDYTSLAFWYQEGPRKVAALPTFKERTATSFADRK